MAGHSNFVIGAFQNIDDSIVSWSTDLSIRIWKTDGSSVILSKHKDKDIKVSSIGEGRFVSWDEKSGEFLIWSKEGKLDLTIPFKGWEFSFLQGPGDTILGLVNDSIMQWDRDGALIHEFKGHAERVTGAIVLPDGSFISWGADYTLRIWTPGMDTRLIFAGPTMYMISGAFILDDTTVLTWSIDSIRIWDIGIKPASGGAKKEKIDINGVVVHPNGNTITWGKDDICEGYVDPLARNGYFLVDHSSGSPGGIHSCSLMYKKLPESLLECCWHSSSGCRPYYLYPDGRVLLSAEGDMCFLQLYDGNSTSPVVDRHEKEQEGTMSEYVLNPADKKLIAAVEEMMAARNWLNEKLVNWDEGPLPENIDEIWFSGWKALYPQIERSDLGSQEIFHLKNMEALLMATFRKYLKHD